MISLVCRECHDAGRESGVLVRAMADGTLVYLDDQSVHGGRFVLQGSLAVEVVANGEPVVFGDGKTHADMVEGLPRYQSHLARHQPPSKRPPSQEVTMPQRPKRIRRQQW